MRNRYILIFFALIFADSMHSSYSQSLQQDSLALVNLYNSTGGINWTNKTNWLTGDLSTWHGVTVSNGRVVTLDLNNNNLKGTIDNTFNLTEINNLNLFNNQLISLDISYLSKLQTLVANNNLLTQLIINTTNNYYPNLYYMELENNQLEELDIRNMPVVARLFMHLNPKLKRLLTNSADSYYLKLYDLYVNQTSLEILDISNMPRLATIYANNTNLTSLITNTSLKYYPNLNRLELAYNNLKLLNISAMPALSIFYCNNSPNLQNLITNDLLNYYYQLYDLRLNNTSLSTLDISNMPKLSVLYANNAQLENIQTNNGISYYTALSRLEIQFNKLGSLDISGMPNLSYLYSQNNKLEYFISRSTNTYYVQSISLDLSHNLLSSLDLSGFKSASNNIYIGSNSLTFEDIESFVAKNFTTYQYSPQANVDLFYNSALKTLSVQVGGANNKYQWTKNGVNISGAANSLLTLTSSDYTANALYQCVITNTLVTGLTLYSVTKHPQDQITDPSLTDFKSKNSGNWSDFTTWKVLNGSKFIDAVAGEIPSSANSVYLEAGHTITLTNNAACKDLNLNTTADVVRLDTKENVLEVWGKLRLYTGTAPETTNSTSAGIAGWISTGTNGRIRLKGTASRIITAKDEFNDDDNLKGWTLECSLSDGAIGTINSNFRSGNLIITSGNLEVKSENFKVSK